MRSAAGVALVVIVAAAALVFSNGEDARVEVSRGGGMDVYEIRPGRGIGPVELGMSRGDARRAMEATGHPVKAIVRWEGRPPVLSMQENSFQVYFGRSDRVEEVEVLGPASDAQGAGELPPFVARYGEVDVFRTLASKLLKAVSRRADPDTTAPAHGAAFTFPTVGIALWRASSTSEKTPFFETVLVFPRKR